MIDLRWVLFLLGVIIFLSIYFFSVKPVSLKSRILFFRLFRSNNKKKLYKKEIKELAKDSISTDLEERETVDTEEIALDKKNSEKVITLRLIGKDQLDSISVYKCLQDNDLTHGRFDIYHYYRQDKSSSVFSVANLTEPGTFNEDDKGSSVIGGLTFFMLVSKNTKGVEDFDKMLELAKIISETLNIELLDENGSSWSIQRERYIREEIIAFQHILNK
ncbi:MAG: hypothetical protein CBC38_06105 [Gammaproteobacteria bacterium TMED78]|nr:MAG: hypothetical protein CBC38_06105 [Gammaproteobacteria bacterium TMED78]|tara:strand:- start:32523 stop:33176 length:654 start_codon:yes stop_codon:yes gene_type:complete